MPAKIYYTKYYEKPSVSDMRLILLVMWLIFATIFLEMETPEILGHFHWIWH